MPHPARRALFGLAVPLLRPAAAEPAWPVRTVRVIVPYPPGGGSDVVARLLLPALSEQPGAPAFVVENRAGAGGTIGTEVLAKSPADGGTLGTITIGTHGTNPWLFPRIGYDPVADFSPIAVISVQPGAVAVPADSPLGSLNDLLAIRQETNFASSGNGTSGHLAGEVLRVMGGLPLVHVPYRSSGAAWADLLGGRVPLIFDNIQNAHPHQQAGRVRILAVTGHGRSGLLPTVPAIRERLPDYLVESWNVLAGPAGLPPALTERMAGMIAAAAATPAVQAKYAELGMELPRSSPEHAAAFIKQQLGFWQRVITQANIRLE
jgi:tripartite-type tricarboxylate transporter receptor subunit TctC